MQMTFRPIQWDGAKTKFPKDSPFNSYWSSTLDLLDRELFHLQAKNVVLQADFREQDIKLDGMVRANARQPLFAGVRLIFDSRHGALVYQTDVYNDWKANVRAIALSLEALRKIDRYGVTKAAEQYKGWKAIESGSDQKPVVRAMLVRIVNNVSQDHDLLVFTRPDKPNGYSHTDQEIYRAALKVAHPDKGGSRETWDAVQASKEVLGL